MAGSSRFLNTIYATDLNVSGTTSFASLDVSGNIVANGTLNIGSSTAANAIIYLNGKKAIAGTDGWLRINEENKFASGVYFGTNLVRTDGSIQVGASGSKINMGTAYARFNVPIYMNNSGNTYKWTTDGNIVVNNVNATTATLGATTITNGKATTLDVSTLNVTHQNIEHVANLGGTFLVTPTVKCISSGSNPTLTSFSVATTSASRENSENVNVTYNYKLTIADTAFTTATIGTITWTQYSEVKVSGTIDGTVLGTCNGYIESIETGNTHRVVINIKYDGTGSLSTPSDITTVDGLTIMLTNIWVNGTEYDPIGIWMKSADSDGRSHISLYGGTTTDPVVRIGNLVGLPKVNGRSPEGWGIYTNHGYFDGVIVSNYGKIGNFTITDALYSIAKSFGSTANNVYIGDDGISLGTTFKVTKEGAMTSTSGNIAAFQIDATALHTANVAITSNADNSIALSHADFTRTVAGASRTGLRFAIGDKFGVTGDGILYGSSVNLTGAINATSGTIGSNATSGNRWQIGDRAIYYGNATPGNSTSTLVISTGTASTKSIGGSDTTSKNWMLAAGTGFGVTTAGVLYATGAHINGAITATSLTLSQGVTIGQDKIDGLTDDLNDAAKTATNYLTFEPAHGLMIANQSDEVKTITTEDGKNVLIDNDSVDIRNGQTVVASFGEDVVLGASENNKLTLTPYNMSFDKPDGTSVFNITASEEYYRQTEYEQVSRPTGTVSKIPIDDNIVDIGIVVDGTALSEDKWYQQGSTIYFVPPIEGANRIEIHGAEQETQTVVLDTPSVTIGQADKSHSVIDADGQRFYADDGITEFAKFTASGIYLGEDDAVVISPTGATKTVWEDESIGHFSFPATIDLSASAVYSILSDGQTFHFKFLVSGGTTDVNFTKGVAHTHEYIGAFDGEYDGESTITVTSHSALYTEGDFFIRARIKKQGGVFSFGHRSVNDDAGFFSATFGDGLLASGDEQTVFGHYNEDDPTKAVIVGNGTATDSSMNRSNALTVDWTGEVALDLDVDSSASSSTAATSGTDMDLFNAIISLGWYDDVIS